MKKQQLLLGSLISLAISVNAQNSNPWPTAAGTNVGIGTSSPASRLEVLNTSNQLRLSYSAAIFSDLQTTSSGYLYINPTGGRVGLGTNAPATGFHSNLGIVRISDAASATRAYQIVPNYAGSGNLPAGMLMSSLLATSGEGVSFIPSGAGTAGVKLGAYAFTGSAWQPVWETQNVSSGFPNLLLLKNGGNVGIGNASPTAKLEVTAPGLTELRVTTPSTSDSKVWVCNSLSSYNFGIDNAAVGHIGCNINSPTPVNILNFGLYGAALPQAWLGSTKPTSPHNDFMFAVAGKIVAQSLYITAAGAPNWADYVFADDYKLPSLYDIEKYYKANKHLPEIPTTKEVEEKGIDVAQMNVLLLKKIEEMTILMVQQQKQIDALNAKVK